MLCEILKVDTIPMNVKILTPDWLTECLKTHAIVDNEEPYRIMLNNELKKTESGISEDK